MEKFSLKWNDFQANVTKSFGLLRRERNLFDVTLVSDSEEHIPAHRLVLSACSDFFKNIFTRVDNQNPLIYLAGVSSGDIQTITGQEKCWPIINQNALSKLNKNWKL